MSALRYGSTLTMHKTPNEATAFCVFEIRVNQTFFIVETEFLSQLCSNLAERQSLIVTDSFIWNEREMEYRDNVVILQLDCPSESESFGASCG